MVGNHNGSFVPGGIRSFCRVGGSDSVDDGLGNLHTYDGMEDFAVAVQARAVYRESSNMIGVVGKVAFT